MASAGGTVPHCQVIWQKAFFTPPHVKFINISSTFFFFGPFRMSSDQVFFSQAVSCRGQMTAADVRRGQKSNTFHDREAKVKVIVLDHEEPSRRMWCEAVFPRDLF